MVVEALRAGRSGEARPGPSGTTPTRGEPQRGVPGVRVGRRERRAPTKRGGGGRRVIWSPTPPLCRPASSLSATPFGATASGRLRGSPPGLCAPSSTRACGLRGPGASSGACLLCSGRRGLRGGRGPGRARVGTFRS